MIYAVILSLVMFLKGVSKELYCLVIAVILALVSGLRGLSVGIDTYQYKMIFERIALEGISNTLIYEKIEQGYLLFNHIVFQLFGNNFQVLIFIAAVLYIIAISTLIFNYSAYPWLSHTLFVGLGYFTFGMSGVRQTLAISLTLLSFVCIKKSKLFFYLLFCGVATLFHLSSLIFFPAYFLSKIKFNKNSFLLAFFIVVAIGLFSEYLFELLNYMARIEYNKIETGGYLMYLFILLTIIIGVKFRVDNVDDILLYMLIATIAIWPLAKMHPTMFRLTFYYSIFIIIYIPNVLKRIEDISLRYLYTSSYVFVSIYFFVNNVVKSDAQLIPYMFFWE